MVITDILLERRVWEWRAAAFAGDRPVAVFHQSPYTQRGVRLGAILDVVLKEKPKTLDGGFCTSATGEDIFVRLGSEPIPLGSQLSVQIVSEARADKVARGRRVSGGGFGPQRSALETWRDILPTKAVPRKADTLAEIQRVDDAFAEALVSHVTLEGGGRLGVSRTPALTALDVDTAGRAGPAGQGAIAKAINLVAAREAARQLSLRDLGGLAVLDCIAPIQKAFGSDIKTAFLETFRHVSSRKAAALAPSRFGLMEVSLAWGARPIDEVLGDGCGGVSPEAALLGGLRMVERDLEARPATALVLALPERAYIAVERHFGGPQQLSADLSRRWGPAIETEISPAGRTEVIRK
ncbi:MAG: ribonuclease E/G [Pseudomonadota bacterium]